MSDSHFLAAWAACAARGRTPLAPTALLPARRSWFDTAAASLGGGRERCTLSAVQSAAGHRGGHEPCCDARTRRGGRAARPLAGAA